MSTPCLLEVRTGHARKLEGHVTAYAKHPRTGPVEVRALRVMDDEVANTRVHGGPDKAVYAYAAANYPKWRADHPEHSNALVFGGFGENLVVDGLDEAGVCIGDKWRIGTALLQPCQPRQPCATLARWFKDPQMVKAMVANGRSGWYLRVLQPGALAAGDALTLEDRPDDAWTIARVLEASYRSLPDPDELDQLANVPGLASGWATWAARQAKAARPKPKPL